MKSFDSLKERYLDSLQKYSDMQEYLPSLLKFGKNVKHITEFGVRTGVSTCAFLCSRPEKMVAYDICKYPEVDELIELAKKENINFEYKLDNVLFVEIDPTDLLFIDTIHNYEQTRAELRLHASKVSKYIIFHDVVQYASQGHAVGEIGIMPAIKEFLNDHANWKVIDFREDGAGLMVLEKSPEYDQEIKVFEKITGQLDENNLKYFLVCSDSLCKQIKLKVHCGDTLISLFSIYLLNCVARYVKTTLNVFHLRMIVVNKKNRNIVVDSDGDIKF